MRTIFGAGGPMVGRLACSLLLSSRPAPPPLLGSIRVCGGSWEGLAQVVVWALVGTPSPGPFQASSSSPPAHLSPGASSLLAGRPPFPRITARAPSSPRQAEQTQCGLERRLEQIRSAARNSPPLLRVRRLNIQPQPGTVKLRYAVMLGPAV